MIVLDELNKSFGTTRALDGVSFRVERGQVFGFIGPNGAGKTTTLRILSTVESPDAGDARIDGCSVIQDADRVRRRIGFMPDHFAATASLTVREYVDIFARAYFMEPQERRKSVGEALEFTGLARFADRIITELSKGMKQRLCLAKTLVHDPPVLLLDEPASGLDPRARIEFRELVRLLARGGKTVIISSHILTELSEICDAVAVIEKGKILATGIVGDVLKKIQPHLEVQMRPAGRATELFEYLASRPGLLGLEADEPYLTVGLAAEDEIPALVRELVGAGFDLYEVMVRKRSLEDVFMTITREELQ